MHDQQNDHVETHGKNWNGLHKDEEKKHLYDVKDYASQNGQEDPDDVYLDRDGFNAPSCYQQNNIYHLPENFRPYTNGHKPEFNSHQSKIIHFPDSPKEHLKVFEKPMCFSLFWKTVTGLQLFVVMLLSVFSLLLSF